MFVLDGEKYAVKAPSFLMYCTSNVHSLCVF